MSDHHRQLIGNLSEREPARNTEYMKLAITGGVEILGVERRSA